MTAGITSRVKRFSDVPLLDKFERLIHFAWLIRTQIFYRPLFGAIGNRSRIIRPLRLGGATGIHLGKDIIVHKLCWLQTFPRVNPNARISIGDGCMIGNFNHITATSSISIGDKVLTADRVFISDHGHAFEDIRRPILEQGVVNKGPVTVGSGSWIGENVAILSCNIGRNCVIGANSVVLSDVPDFSVAVGTPARVIRRYSQETQMWVRV